MTYSIIGSGKLGTALARQFARNGIEFGLANTRGPDTLTALAQELGKPMIAQSLQEALKADIVILAIPFKAHREIGLAISDWKNRIVIDAMNTYGVSPEELGDRESTDIVASAFAGARVVKTFNQLPAALLAKHPEENGGRRVMFLWGRDHDANTQVVDLVGQLGFAAINLGMIEQGSKLLSLGGPLILQNIIKHP